MDYSVLWLVCLAVGFVTGHMKKGNGLQTMRPTLEQCVDELLRLTTYSETKIDVIVNTYLAGFGRQTATMRAQLADTFKKRAPPSELSDRIWRRIRRRDPD